MAYIAECNWCNFVADSATVATHEKEKHQAEIKAQHLQEWGHELGSEECLDKLKESHS